MHKSKFASRITKDAFKHAKSKPKHSKHAVRPKRPPATYYSLWHHFKILRAQGIKIGIKRQPRRKS